MKNAQGGIQVDQKLRKSEIKTNKYLKSYAAAALVFMSADF